VGGRERLDKALQGGKADLMINIVEGPMDFVVIADSIAQYQKTVSVEIFNSPQFKDFVRKQIENSMAVVRDAYNAQARGTLFKGESGGHTRAVYEQFLKSQQAQLLRQMYGNEWFDRTFNVDF
jgi:ABC-type molybdate transport system substrate-binding protein